MKRSIGLWQLFGFAFVSFFGTLLHFLYEWSGENIFAALISGVNESTFEHMKLLFFPMFVFSFIERAFFKERHDFWNVKFCGILLGILLIPVIFYTYNGVIGKSPDFINISIFFVSAAVAFLYEVRLFKEERNYKLPQICAFSSLLVLAFLFSLLTFFTPRLGLFIDPLSGTYGI